MTARVRLDHIRKVYVPLRGEREHVAFDDISLEIAPSDFVAIVGPSGCGKSTLLRIAAGLTDASAGGVSLDDKPIVGPPEGVIYLFQQYAKSLFPWRSVLANVTFAMEDQRIARAVRTARARELLHQVGLQGFEDRFPWQMSGGMQQRVAIARAIAAEPRVLLLDEPFSAVDALTRLELQALILQLWAQKRFTAILVTHDADEAIFMADRIVVLSRPPTRIVRIIDVELERPRDIMTTREDPRFLSLRHELTTMLLRSGEHEHA